MKHAVLRRRSPTLSDRVLLSLARRRPGSRDDLGVAGHRDVARATGRPGRGDLRACLPDSGGWSDFEDRRIIAGYGPRTPDFEAGGGVMLMRTDPVREFDRLAQQMFGTRMRPASMPMDAYREGARVASVCLPQHPAQG